MNSSDKSQTHGILKPLAIGQEFTLSRGQPSSDLRPFIEHFWIVSWDFPKKKSYVSETLPFPSVHIVIEKDHAEINGVHTQKFSRRLQGQGRAFGIKFRPGMFYPFLGKAVSSLTDQVVKLQTIWGNEGTHLRKIILAEPNEKICIQQAEAFLRARLPKNENLTALKIRDVVEKIATNREIIRVEQIADLAGLSLRPLQRAFLRYVGVSPKWVLARYRLQEAAEILTRDPNIKISDLALQLGYFDQAHFTRDFKSSIGKTPLQYLKTAQEKIKKGP